MDEKIYLRLKLIQERFLEIKEKTLSTKQKGRFKKKEIKHTFDPKKSKIQEKQEISIDTY